MNNCVRVTRPAGIVLWTIIMPLVLAVGCATQTPSTPEVCRPRDDIAFSVWRGVTPSRTPESEVIALLGEPDNIAPYSWEDDSSAYHYYPRPGRCDFFTVVVQGGIVQSVTEVTASGPLSSTLLSGLVEAGCDAVVVTQTISPNPVYAYPQLGVAFEVGSDGSALVEQHFAPLNSSDYLAGWSGVDLRLDPAFNAIHTMERLSIEPGVTTQAEVEQLLRPGARVGGVRVVWERSGESPSGLPELEYQLGPTDRTLPSYGPARLAFQGDVLFTVWFQQWLSSFPGRNGEYLPGSMPPGGQIYTLGDALREYGEPTLVLVTECEDQCYGGDINELHLVYPREGRQVTASAIWAGTDLYCLTLNSRVKDVLYFPPVSEEEFRQLLPMIWHEDFVVTDSGDSRFIGGSYREVEWQGITQFCEWNHRSGCLQP